jgi:hypothetical protein
MKRRDSEIGAFSRLRQFSMLRQRHVSSKFEQYSFHGEFTLPLSKAGQLGRINLSASLVNAWNVDTRDELNRRRVVRVICAAVEVDTVYPVLVDALQYRSAM